MERGSSYGDFDHEPYERLMERQLHAIYRNCNNQRRMELDEITEIRDNNRKLFMETLTQRIGPNWYQIFSTKQRAALDVIKTVIYRTLLSTKLDLLYRTLKLIGIYRIPIKKDLMSCVYMASEDPKELFAKMFHYTYGHTFDLRIAEYDLNGKLLLTSMYHVGLSDLTSRLTERFRPDTIEPSPPAPKVKDKKRPTKPVSPYLERCIAPCWKKPGRKPFVPEPLPNLESLNEPFEPTPVPSVVEAESTERLRRNFAECDRMLGVDSGEPAVSPVKHPKHSKRTVPIFGQYNRKKAAAPPPTIYDCKGKLVTPSCLAAGNVQYQISGIFCVKGKYEYILGGVIQLPPQGDVIHGGYMCLSNGVKINIFMGFRAMAPPRKLNDCDCEQKYEHIVFDYLKSAKCRCGHGYDFGHEDTFPEDQIPYFTKPTKELPMSFNYNAIYELDPKKNLIKQEFQNLWNKDSMLNTAANRGPECDSRPTQEPTRKLEGNTCLGDEPKDIDYLRCALGHLRRVNIAARLPDVHRAPELKEWMRNRIHGPLTPRQRARIADMSKLQSNFFHNLLTLQKWGHLYPDNNRDFYELSDWGHLKRLKKDFAVFTEKYRKELYLKNAYITNLFWTVLYQGEVPSHRFRDIYFSYMVDGLGDFYFKRPYSSKESFMRARFIDTNRMLCIPHEVQMFKDNS